MRVLILDDSNTSNEFLCSVLYEMGIETLSIVDVDELVGKIEEFDPDILILDLFMPKKSGLVVAEETTATYPNLPIFFFTGSQDRQHKISAFKNGAVRYLEKPIDLKKLSSALAQYAVHLQVCTL